MSHCGSPGMCGRRADCEDTHCPGRGTAGDDFPTPTLMEAITGIFAAAILSCLVVGFLAWLFFYAVPILSTMPINR